MEPINIRKARPDGPEYDQTRQRIVDTAIELMAEQGLSRLRFEQLAKRVGCNRTTIYRYFDSKRDLVTAAMKTLMIEITENIIAETAGTRETTPRKVADNFYGIIHALRSEDRYRVIMDAQNIEQFMELSTAHLSEVTAQALSRFMVNADMGRVLRKDVQLDDAVHWVFHQIISYGFFGLKGTSEAEQKRYLERMVVPVLFDQERP